MVARWAHNPKVVGPNPTSATKIIRPSMGLFLYGELVMNIDSYKERFLNRLENMTAEEFKEVFESVLGTAEENKPILKIEYRCVLIKEKHLKSSDHILNEYFKEGWKFHSVFNNLDYHNNDYLYAVLYKEA